MDEVSIVDTPANEREFLVTKNEDDQSEVSNMGNSAAAKQEGAEAVTVEQTTTAQGAEVAKALESVRGIVGSFVDLVSKGSSTNDNSGEGASGGDNSSDAEETDTSKGKKAKPKNFGEAMQAALAKSGLEGEALTKAVADTLKTLGLQADQAFPAVTKAAEEGEPEETPAIDEDEAVQKQLETVAAGLQKAARMTPARVSKIMEALEALKLVMEGVAPGQSPKTKTPGNNSFGGSGITSLTKSADGGEEDGNVAIAKALTGLTEAVTKMNGRLDEHDKILKAKPASESEDDESEPANTSTKKSLWAGLL